MRGQVLDFNYRTASGEISGEDGARYKFVGTEWRPQQPPRAGIRVDFEVDGSSATSIYALLKTSPVTAGTGTPDKLVAGLLALFLGTIGIHKFYLGYNRAGLTMLLVSVFGAILLFIPTFVMAIIAFVEAIIYLTKSDAEWESMYVTGEKPWF